MSELAPTEIIALARILPDLDYYQLLHLQPGASPTQIRQGYQATARAFHPDGHVGHEEEIRAAVAVIAKRVTEAYSVLRNPQRRQVYDKQLAAGGARRIEINTAQAAAGKEQVRRQGETPQGRQYFKLAEADLARGDLAAAIRNLQTAYTFEPGNAFFKQQLEATRKKLNETPL